jgi:chromosome partitioning protein
MFPSANPFRGRRGFAAPTHPLAESPKPEPAKILHSTKCLHFVQEKDFGSLTRNDEAMGLARLLPRPHPRTSDGPSNGKGPTIAKVIAFANQKGGVAKTTTTLNLGVALAEQQHRVLLIDLDPQGNLTMSQGMNPDEIERSMFDVLVHKIPIDEVIETREVDLAVSSIDHAGAELSLSSMIGRERALEKALAPVLDRYEFILIDTPPSLGLLTINALVAAEGVIVPVQCEYLSLRGLVQLENTLTMIRENLNPTVAIVGILPTMWDRRLLHSREAVEILRENFGELVLNTKIRKTVRYAEAPVKGESVLKYDPTGEAAEMYRDLAKEVLRNGAKARIDA